MNRFKTLLALLLVSTPTCFLSAQADEPPIIASIEIRGLNTLKSDITSIATALQMPIPPEMISGFLGGYLLSPTLEGLDADGPIRIYIVESEGMGTPPLVYDLPLTDDASYLKLLQSAASDSGESDGIHRLMIPAGPGPNMAMGKPLYVAKRNDRILIGYDRNTVSLLAEATAQPLSSRVDGTLTLALDAAALRGLADKMYTNLDAVFAHSEPDEDMPDMASAMQAQRRFIHSALSQLSSYSLGIAVRGPYLSLQSRWEPTADSVLSRMIRDLQPPDPSYLRLAPDNALVAAVGYLALPDEAIDALIDFMRGMYAAIPDGKDMIAEFEAAMEIARDQLQDGSYALYILPPSGAFPFDMAQFYQVDQPAEFRDKLIENTKRMSEIYATSTLYKGSEIEIQDPRSYRDTSIDSVTQRLQVKGQEDLSDILPDFLNWFQHTQYEYAFVGTTMIQTIGSEQTMNDAIDRVLENSGQPIHQSRAFHSIFPDAPTDAIDYTFVSLGKILEAILRTTGLVPDEVIHNLPIGPTVLGAYSSADGSDLKINVRLSISDLGAMIQTFTLLQAQVAGQMQDSKDDDWDPFDTEDDGF